MTASSDSSPWSQQSLSSGRSIAGGRFILVRQLGRGGMGVVWLATDTQLDEEVAIKFLPPEIRADAVALDNVRQEAARSRQLSHPNIVRIHDLHADDDGTLVLSMEFVNGKNFNELRLDYAGNSFPWATLAPWINQLCHALDYAHGEQLIHRDLKPANVMLDARGRVKLADFGIAATAVDSMSRVSVERPPSGTLPFMSPQQLNGRAPRVTDDIYALGATIYDLLTGRPPFHSGDIPFQVRELSPEPIQDRLQEIGIENEVPPAVSAMVMACLAKDPEQRPQQIRNVADWIGLSDWSNPPDNHSSIAPEPTGKAESHAAFWAWALGGFALLTLLVMGGWFWFVKPPTDQSPNRASLPSPPGIGAELESGFFPIFNGRDLSGWSGDSSSWSVIADMLDGWSSRQRGNPERSQLIWNNGSPADFELRLRFRFDLNHGKSQSGFFAVGIRSSNRDVASDRDTGYLVRLSGDEDSRGSICADADSFPPLVPRGQSRTIKPGDNREYSSLGSGSLPPDPTQPYDWNDLVIRAQGELVTVDINGVQTAELHDQDVNRRPDGGTIMMVIRRGGFKGSVRLQLKDIRLKNLPSL